MSVFARMRASAISYEPLLVGINNVVGTSTGLYIYKKNQVISVHNPHLPACISCFAAVSVLARMLAW